MKLNLPPQIYNEIQEIKIDGQTVKFYTEGTCLYFQKYQLNIFRKLLSFAKKVKESHPKINGKKYYDCKQVAESINEFLEGESELFPYDVFRAGVLSVKEGKKITFFKPSDFSDHYVNYIQISDPRDLKKKIFIAFDMTASYNVSNSEFSCDMLALTAESMPELSSKLGKLYGIEKSWEEEEELRLI